MEGCVRTHPQRQETVGLEEWEDGRVTLAGRVGALFIEMGKSLAGGVSGRGGDRKGQEGSRFRLGAQISGWTSR